MIVQQPWLDEARHSLLQNPNPNPNPSHNPNLGPSNSTAFKRENRRKRRERKRVEKLQERLEILVTVQNPNPIVPPNPLASSTVEWPCKSAEDPDPNLQPTGWPDPIPPPAAARPPATATDQIRLAALQAQQNGLKAAEDFFSKNDDDDDDDDEGEGEEESEMKYLNFFVELFEKDEILRGFYEKNWEKGEFCCLVCGGIGEKVGKKFVNCVGLVQHSRSISKTKRRRAHRGFGMAVCRVLGWDVDSLPGIFLDCGVDYRQSLIEELNETEVDGRDLMDGVEAWGIGALLDEDKPRQVDMIDK